MRTLAQCRLKAREIASLCETALKGQTTYNELVALIARVEVLAVNLAYDLDDQYCGETSGFVNLTKPEVVEGRPMTAEEKQDIKEAFRRIQAGGRNDR